MNQYGSFAKPYTMSTWFMNEPQQFGNGHVCEQPAYLNQTRWMDKSPTFTSFLKLSDEQLKATNPTFQPMIDIAEGTSAV